MYPDSMPKNWRDILTDFHITIIISPLHDKDINPDGTPKKPHYHVLLIFDTVKTKKQAEEISSSVNGTNCIMCQSVNGMIRYTIHKDNPEKAQYDRKDIDVIGSYDVDEAFKNSIDRYIMIKEMIEYIKNNNVTEYIDFMEFCANNKFEDWFKLLCDNCSFVIQGAITSNRHKLKEIAFNGKLYNDDEEE